MIVDCDVHSMVSGVPASQAYLDDWRGMVARHR
jgi:hypothetical protein